MEQGFIYFLFEDAEQFNAKADNGQHKTFYKLADYIEENSPISDLLLENLEALFGLQIALNVALLFSLLFIRFTCTLKPAILRIRQLNTIQFCRC